MVWLLVVGAIGAFLFGIWLGLPGRYTQTPEDIERIMTSGVGRRRARKQHFTPLAWVQRRAAESASRDTSEGRQRGFRIEAPKSDPTPPPSRPSRSSGPPSASGPSGREPSGEQGLYEDERGSDHGS